MIKTVLSAALFLLALPAFAQAPSGEGSAPAQQPPAAPQPVQAAPAAETGDTRVRCRSIYQTNSRIPDRICRTQAEWDRMEQETREALERSRRGAGTSGN